MSDDKNFQYQVDASDLAKRTKIVTKDQAPITLDEIGKMLDAGFYEVIEVSHEDGEVHSFLIPMGGSHTSDGDELWINSVADNHGAVIVPKDSPHFFDGMYVRKVPHLKPLIGVCIDTDYLNQVANNANK